TSSAEAHAKQRQLAKERKASKPNADIIERSKKIWERLRRKSHVPLDERKRLIAELFDIITGQVRDFVFKHDSVRVVQCALKYGNLEQRRMIAEELRGEMRQLVESRYGKFMVAKLVIEGDQAIRDLIVPEFYGHVKRLINHPEAGWIVDDIYRGVATSRQKAVMLREWYGTEFALANRDGGVGGSANSEETADLKSILEKNPEKRKPILEFTLQMINSLLQKKMTGFTMLHDAMLQYFLVLTSGSEEQTAFLDLLKADIETKAEAKDSTDASGGGDLFRNLSFTKSGSRLVCLALAHGSAKDRKIILRCFKNHVEMMARDQHAFKVVVTALEVPDDTRMTGKGILHELLGANIENEEQRHGWLEQMVCDGCARIPVLYTLGVRAKWLLNDEDKAVIDEVLDIRTTTSKKAPDVRRTELVEYLAQPLLDLVCKKTESLAQSTVGCLAMTEILFEAHTEGTTELREQAKHRVAELAQGDPSVEGNLGQNAAAGRMLKNLLLGGPFDLATRDVKLAEPTLRFADALFPVIEEHLVTWACGPSSFVVVALLESRDVPEEVKDTAVKRLVSGKKQIRDAAGTQEKRSSETSVENGKAKKKGKGSGKPEHGNAGAKILLQKI
ncbi:hypothetical protein BAUCODRAFT_40021, partial [Baudoinia panamericana UAMH 10762]